MAVRDADHLRSLAMDAFTTGPEVAHIETSPIVSYVRNASMPRYA